MSTEPTTPAPVERPRAVLRVSRAALLGVAVLFIGTTTFVAADPTRWGWLVLAPVLAAAWVFRVQTTADADGLVARSSFRSRTVPWSDVDGVRFPRRGWGRAVLRDGSEVWLPGVAFNDLRVLAVVSDGRVPDPFAAAAGARAAREAEEDSSAGPEDGPVPPSAPGLTW